MSHFGAEDERSVNGEAPARWPRLPSLILTNTLSRRSWRFAHRRPEPVFCGAGCASAGRDRRDGGVFYGGKANSRSHISRAFVSESSCLSHHRFVEDGSSASHSGWLRQVMISLCRTAPFFLADPPWNRPAPYPNYVMASIKTLTTPFIW